jgi:hypothetical protein
VEGEADPQGLTHPRCAVRRERRVKGESLDGVARLLGPQAESLVEPLLRAKYGPLKRGLDLLNAFLRLLARRPKPAAEYIEILPARH